MATLLSGTIQPPLLTLLSSTSDPSLSPLFTISTDPSTPNDSFISTIPDTLTSPEASGSKRKKFDHHYVSYSDDNGESRRNVVGQIIHIQSPDPRTTYIQAGRPRTGKGKERASTSTNDREPLGVELPWVGIQAKRLGRRGMSFEFGVVDTKGREGVIRISSYKSNPTVHPHREPPLIHLPLELPKTDQHTLTQWLDIKLNLASLLPLFNTLPRPQVDSANIENNHKRRKTDKVELPNDQFGYVSYVRVYANCRLRRIWFSADGERTLDQAGVKDEWALYAAQM